MATKILAFAGSSRKDSFNKKLVKIALEGARESGAEVKFVDLLNYEMPIFSEDLEKAEGMPQKAKEFRQLLIEHDGFLISSPEYNSSITALLKNAIDWASRPVDGGGMLEAFNGKVAGIMSSSPGGLGGLRGLVHLRAILSSIKVLVIPDQIAVGSAFKAFDESGNLVDEKQSAAVKSIGARVAELAAKINDK